MASTLDSHAGSPPSVPTIADLVTSTLPNAAGTPISALVRLPEARPGVSKPKACAMRPLVRDVDVGALIEEVVALTEPLLAGKPVRLEVMSCSTLPTTFPTDPAFLRRILTNLLSHAVKVTELGSITLVAEGEPGALVLRVADTGLGIKEADLQRLVAGFGQPESPTTQRHSGTDRGLATVKGLVDALGGAIVVDSRERLGTRFTVRLLRGRIEEAKTT